MGPGLCREGAEVLIARLYSISSRALSGKAVVARFDGGQLSSEGGLLALREIERQLGLAVRLVPVIVPMILFELLRRSTPCSNPPPMALQLRMPDY